MNNMTQKWRDGWLEDHPLSRFEKLKSTRHEINEDKHRTVKMKRSRLTAHEHKNQEAREESR